MFTKWPQIELYTTFPIWLWVLLVFEDIFEVYHKKNGLLRVFPLQKYRSVKNVDDFWLSICSMAIKHVHFDRATSYDSMDSYFYMWALGLCVPSVKKTTTTATIAQLAGKNCIIVEREPILFLVHYVRQMKFAINFATKNYSSILMLVLNVTHKIVYSVEKEISKWNFLNFS